MYRNEISSPDGGTDNQTLTISVVGVFCFMYPTNTVNSHQNLIGLLGEKKMVAR